MRLDQLDSASAVRCQNRRSSRDDPRDFWIDQNNGRSSGSTFGASRFGDRTDFRPPQIKTTELAFLLDAGAAPGGEAAYPARQGAAAHGAPPAGRPAAPRAG